MPNTSQILGDKNSSNIGQIFEIRELQQITVNSSKSTTQTITKFLCNTVHADSGSKLLPVIACGCFQLVNIFYSKKIFVRPRKKCNLRILDPEELLSKPTNWATFCTISHKFDIVMQLNCLCDLQNLQNVPACIWPPITTPLTPAFTSIHDDSGC